MNTSTFLKYIYIIIMHLYQFVAEFLDENLNWQQAVKIDRCACGHHSPGQQQWEPKGAKENSQKFIE